MNEDQALAIYGCVRGSLTGEMTFPQIVGRLSEIGVERYHADYSRQETTYYLASGDSLVVTVPHEDHATAQEFSAAAVEAAVRQSQRGEHGYRDFVRKTMAAGCVGYFVQITGRRAIYFGRNGEAHVELFPQAPQERAINLAQANHAMPTITGLLETALYVADPKQSAAFYRRLFDFGVLLESERLIALDVAGQNVLLLFKQGATREPFATPGGIIPGHDGSGQTHFAFSIGGDEMPQWKERLESLGVAIESMVAWEGGAQSLYFRDPDQHLGELITPGFWRMY